MEEELTALDIATVKAECLRELLMVLPIVEKSIPTILINFDNQTVIMLSVKIHRRVATGNMKSREVVGELAGTAPSSTARNPGTRRGF